MVTSCLIPRAQDVSVINFTHPHECHVVLFLQVLLFERKHENLQIEKPVVCFVIRSEVFTFLDVHNNISIALEFVVLSSVIVESITAAFGFTFQTCAKVSAI